MHPDRKIGIAMGILLIGVVAALFFRNEPLAIDSGLTTARENEINQRLRDRDVTVFLGDPTEADATAEPSEPRWSMPDLLGDLTTRKDEVPVPIGGPPIATERERRQQQTESEQAVATNETEANATTNVTTSGADAASQNSSESPQGPEREYIEYTVEFGDTLSEIAQKFLGSQSRFREIYEANKDRMDSPDRLRVGKAIRIPRSLH